MNRPRKGLIRNIEKEMRYGTGGDVLEESIRKEKTIEKWKLGRLVRRRRREADRW